MNSNTVSQVSQQVESLLSEILPDIEQLLEQYEVLETLKIHLVELGQPENALTSSEVYLRNGFAQYPCRRSQLLNELPQYDGGLGLAPEKAQQFSIELASKLSRVFPRLSQSAQQSGESFEVHLSINPATVNLEQPIICEWVNDLDQGSVLQCSKLVNAVNIV